MVGLEKWIEVFHMDEERMNPRRCQLCYNVVNKMVFKNLIIDYSTVCLIHSILIS